MDSGERPSFAASLGHWLLEKEILSLMILPGSQGMKEQEQILKFSSNP